MIGNIGDLETDPEASTSGVPLDLGAGRTLWVRRAGGHNRAWALGLAEQAAEGPDDEDADDYAYDLNKRVAAERLISRWEGFVDEAGKDLAYTPEAGVELFDRAPEILQDVLTLAMTRDSYRLAEDKKNLK